MLSYWSRCKFLHRPISFSSTIQIHKSFLNLLSLHPHSKSDLIFHNLNNTRLSLLQLFLSPPMMHTHHAFTTTLPAFQVPSSFVRVNNNKIRHQFTSDGQSGYKKRRTNSCPNTTGVTTITTCKLDKRMNDSSFSKSGSSNLHPVLKLIKERYMTSSKPKARKDPYKLALCIEGGGMRGSIAAGMVAAIKYIGYKDVFDVIYGSSAGSIVGAYFLADQVPIYGPKIYYDVIPKPNKKNIPFIDISNLFTQRRPVLLLDRLIDDIMNSEAPLNWNQFLSNYQFKKLIPIVTQLSTLTSVSIQDFKSKHDFLLSIKASARIPGITGNIIQMNNDYYSDALLTEAIPFKSAIVNDDSTHVLVLRTKFVNKKKQNKKNKTGGIYEKYIAPFNFDRHQLSNYHDIINYLKTGTHIKQYYKDIHTLNQCNLGHTFHNASILSISPNVHTISQLECDPRKIFNAVKYGFTIAYHTLSPFANSADASTEHVQYNGDFVDENDDMHEARRIANIVFNDEEIEQVEQNHEQLKSYYKVVRKRAKRIQKFKLSKD